MGDPNNHDPNSTQFIWNFFMKINFYRSLLSFILIIFSLLFSISVRADQVDDYIQSEMKKNKIPGLSIAVIKNDKIIKAKGYGLANIELIVPATPDTVYQSGSTGKQFTATLVMMLVEKGKIKLDAKVSKYIKGTPKSWEKITIRHLLTHTSGLKNYDNYINPQRDYTDEQLIKLSESYPLDFEPGEKWKYSNTGYMVLGVIIKKVSGKFYGDLLHENIFIPLGMKTAGVVDTRKIIPNRAAGYELVNNDLQNQAYVPPSLSRTADGTLYMTVLDFSKWDAALYTDKLLKKSDLDLMFTPVKLNNGKTFSYGFGWFIGDMNGHRLIEHGGEFQGFSSYISRYVDDKLTIIILSNRAYIADDIGDMAHHIAGLYESALIPTKLIRYMPVN